MRADRGAPGRALLLALVVAWACSPGPQSGASPEPRDPPAPAPSATLVSPTLPPSPASTVTPSPPSLAAVTRSIGGRALVDGTPVAGVRIRGMLPYLPGHSPPPDVTAVTDASGGYTLSFPVWTSEALGGNSPLMVLSFELPAGFVLVGVTKSAGIPGSPPNMVMLLQDDLGTGPIDITLGRGHVIEGTLTTALTGTPLVGIGVTALRPNSMLIYGGAGDAIEIEGSATTDATGRYRLTVRSGTYVIYTPGPRDDQRRFWSDDPAVFQATPLKVERDVVGIDIAIVPTTQLWGQVRPGASPEGEAGIRVAAYLAGGAPCCRLVGLAKTGYGGTFVMYVPQGRYRIVFDPPAGSPYAAQWWDRATGFATSTDVSVGSEPVRLEVELPRRSP